MKKRSAIILAIILSLAMLVGIGCTAAFAAKKNNGSASADDTTSFSNGDVAASNVLLNQSPTVTIGVTAQGITARDLKKMVTVKDSNGNVVDFDVTGGTNSQYGIVPATAYIAGAVYTISIGEKVTFTDKKYARFRNIDIIIEKEDVDNVKYKDGVISLEAGEYAVLDGSTVALSSEKDVMVGSAIILTGEKKQSAYVVETITRNAGGVLLGVVDAKPEEIIEEIDVKKDVDMLEGDIELNEEDLISQLEQGNISALVIDLGFAKPTITVENFGLDLANSSVTIDIVFRIPLDGTGYSQFEIRVANVIKVDPSVNFSTAPFSFNLTAKMNVVTTTTFRISAGYSQSGMYDASVIAEKLAALTGKPINEAALRVFKWSYPIGPLFISYELDFFFNVTLFGEAKLVGVSEANYVLGAYYNNNEFKAIAEKGESKKFTLTNAELYGSANMNAGIRNTLALELLQIVRVGIQIDLGAYMDIYGAVKFNLDNIKETNAGFYLDFGLFYDVNILAGLDLFGLIKIQEKFNLAYDRLQLVEVGSKVMNLDYVKDVNEITIYSNTGIMPNLSMSKYNLISRQTYSEVLAYEDSEYTLPVDAYFTLNDGVIAIKKDAPASFTQTILVNNKANKQIKHSITIKKLSDVPHAANDYVGYDKGTNNAVEFELVLRGGSVGRITGEGITSEDYQQGGNKLVINTRFFAKKANGVYKLTVETSKGNFDIFVKVYGVISLFAEGQGTSANPYLIYSQEQVVEFMKDSNINTNYNGVYFTIDCDIDMRGVTVSPIAIFEGNLKGKSGKEKISNFNISSVYYDGETLAGFIAVNRGMLFGFALEANVNVNAQNAKVGIVAAINDGNIISVSATGNVNVSYKTTASRHANIIVGGLVGVNNKNVIGQSSNAINVGGSINVSITGSSIASNLYAANLVGMNKGTINEFVSIDNALNYNKKVGLKCYINGIANS